MRYQLFHRIRDTTHTVLNDGSGIRIDPHAYGKQPALTVDDLEQEFYLDRLFELKMTRDVFEHVEGEYRVREGIDQKLLERHLIVDDRHKLDGFLEKFIDIYHQLALEVERSNLRSLKLSVENAVGVFIDMMGSEMPECGFRTLGVNLLRAMNGDKKHGLTSNQLITAMQAKAKLMRHLAPSFDRVRGRLKRLPETSFVEDILARFCHLPADSLIWDLVEKVIQDIKSRFSSLPHGLERFAILFKELGDGSFKHRALPVGLERDCWIVSADIRKSKVLAADEVGAHYKRYLVEQIIPTWVPFFDGYHVAYRGDEVIALFDEESSALGFVGAVSIHTNDFCRTSLKQSGCGIGISKGPVIERWAGGQRSVTSGPRAAKDYIALACAASKDGRKVQLNDGRTMKELDARGLFTKYVLSRVSS